MDNVIPLFPEKDDEGTKQLVKYSNDMALLTGMYLDAGADLKELSIIAGHRVSEMLLSCSDGQQVWEILKGILDEKMQKRGSV